MCTRRDYRLNVFLMVLTLCASVMQIRGQGPPLEKKNAVSQKGVAMESEGGHRTYVTTIDPQRESEVHVVTTASPPDLPHHRPLFKGFLLHEALLTKDFRGQQHFFTEDGVAEGHPTPAPSSHLAGDTYTQVVPHEDAPAFSDVVATTATVAATLPMTTVATITTALPISVAAKDGGRAPAVEKAAATTGSLTTPVAHASEPPFRRDDPALATPMVEGPPLPDTVTVATSLAPPALTTAGGKGEADTRGPTVEHDTGPSGEAAATTSSSSGDVDDETMTTTIITTTIITTMQTPVECNVNFTNPEGYIDTAHLSSAWLDSTVDCTFTVTVYLGYGVEVQVLNVSLSEGETVTLEDLGGQEHSVLANESILMKGLVVRSSSNQITIRFQSEVPQPGSFLLRYQAFVLSCPFPQRPAYGDVSVTSLHANGEAYFYCFTGYQLLGPSTLTCRNATTPYWSGREPQCLAACGGMVKNATLGRIVSPGFPGNYSNNLTCHWVLEAPEGQRLHIHFEKVALAEDDDRLLIKDGNNIDSPAVYDSYEVEYLPNEGIVSTSRHLFVEFTTDGSGTSTGAAIRYEAFARGNCYEPFVKYGNFTSSDSTYSVGTVVEFTCDPGYTLEQGSVIIECMDPENPQWNETEPACRAVCSGEITDSAGVVLSPNWPEAYDKGQDCIWGIHVEEDKRIMLDIQVLHVGKNDMLTFYDGDDLTANILGQYSGSHPRFKLYTSMADVTVQFQTDPATNIFGYNNGFVVHFFEVPRNDTCPELPEITNGWKSTSHPELIHGTVVTYQCYPGFQVAGTETLMCQWDLTWSGDVPSCERVTSCSDPGNVDHSRRVTQGSRFAVGSTVQYICNKGYALSGSGLLTCHSRDSASPKWSDRLPKCVPETYEPCRNPGAPSSSIQSTEKRFYQAGETLTFSCMSGYELQGQPSIRCIPGHPSQWSGPPPACRASSLDYLNERRLDVASSDLSMEGTNIAIAVLIPAAVVMVLIVGIYLYFSKVQGKSLRLPMSTSPPYDHMTVESAFDNPIYETGDAMVTGALSPPPSHHAPISPGSRSLITNDCVCLSPLRLRPPKNNEETREYEVSI
ncbi:seizure protein 6 homolog isoform X2 [Megalops cyprinoides]|uniref:seizure protein 6 homolog isoform X2 n=1 Tax=Megalops cyprinoides TaxID=118141 RepID=UPI001864DCBF|nr:seizure protein 6 homolog isoform X2 [Megalops cyprinoides]